MKSRTTKKPASLLGLVKSVDRLTEEVRGQIRSYAILFEQADGNARSRLAAFERHVMKTLEEQAESIESMRESLSMLRALVVPDEPAAGTILQPSTLKNRSLLGR